MLQAAASAPISPFDFEASVSDTAAAGIWYFEGIEAAIAECDQDCDSATSEGDYDEAGRIFAIQQNLRKVAALNPQPNAKATLESFVHNFEAMKVLSYLKENKLKEQEKAYAACKQFTLAKESRGAADAAHADGELYVKELQVRFICYQACGLHLHEKYHPAQSSEQLHCIALQKTGTFLGILLDSTCCETCLAGSARSGEAHSLPSARAQRPNALGTSPVSHESIQQRRSRALVACLVRDEEHYPHQKCLRCNGYCYGKGSHSY